MKLATPHIPTVVIRRNKTGSYKMRLSINIGKKFNHKRVELGLGSMAPHEIETLSILTCKIFSFIGLCTHKGLSFFHEKPRLKFHHFEEKPLQKENYHISKNDLDKIELYFEKKDIFLIKSENGHLFPFFTNTISSNILVLIVVNIKKENTCEAENFARKILSVVKRAGSYASPILRAIHFRIVEDDFLQSANYKLITFNEQ